MASTDSSVQTRPTSYWQDQGLAISAELISHEEFPLNFTRIGDVEGDVATFLQGVGHEEMLTDCPPTLWPLRGLAEKVRATTKRN
jgi:hypothetical protein